jgi:cob(I)alamin adenosyltransferase
MNLKKGYVHVYTGNGKGKTTAALGVALRAAGHNLKTIIIQFLKGNINYGELLSTKKLAGLIEIYQMGRENFVDPKNPDPKDIKLAKKGFEFAKQIILKKKYDIVILDEINVAIAYGLIPLKDVIELIKERPSSIELILTGRWAHTEIIALSDIVTEMKEIKHYYKKGITSRRGIDL